MGNKIEENGQWRTVHRAGYNHQGYTSSRCLVLQNIIVMDTLHRRKIPYYNAYQYAGVEDT